MWVYKTVENIENTDSFSEICSVLNLNTHPALYFEKTSKKHVFEHGNSSPLFWGDLKTRIYSFPEIRSIIRGTLEGGCFKTVKTVTFGVKTVKTGKIDRRLWHTFTSFDCFDWILTVLTSLTRNGSLARGHWQWKTVNLPLFWGQKQSVEGGKWLMGGSNWQ